MDLLNLAILKVMDMVGRGYSFKPLEQKFCFYKAIVKLR